MSHYKSARDPPPHGAPHLIAHSFAASFNRVVQALPFSTCPPRSDMTEGVGSSGPLGRPIQVEDSSGATRDVEIAPDQIESKPSAQPVEARRRESTLDSVDQAEGIFDLYERDRDSWRVPSGTAEQSNVQEELADPTSPVSWEGPMSALALPANGSRRSSMNPPPGITVTPDKTLWPGRDNHRDSSLSASTSTSTSFPNSPTRKSMNGLSPALRVVGNGSASTSQVSVAASSQYPGEEDDAFHVRSTCTFPAARNTFLT